MVISLNRREYNDFRFHHPILRDIGHQLIEYPQNKSKTCHFAVSVKEKSTETTSKQVRQAIQIIKAC